MSVSLLPIDHLSMPKAFQIHASYFNPYRTISRLKCSPVRCCDRRREGISVRTKKNYYELLGVSVDSSSQKIKEAYRNLLKKHHPDIAGHKGHEYTLLLNEAYNVLMAEDLRTKYDDSIGHMTVQFGTNNYVNVKGSSSWKGPLRPQALFVDENACIGCRECVHHASNTFILDKSTGCARVRTQYGDDEHKIEVSVESCPVNCIYWVDREELALLEFLTQPQPKQGYGVYGQGWEKPANVFMAAKTLSKQLRQQAENNHNSVRTAVEEETPAQAEARANASLKIKMESFSKIWDSLNEIFG
ncbi:CHAPERONE PROTEIN DNAJ C76 CHLOROPLASTIC [Salix purpurea]|uniref:CHAPERONE PROTEIN DNAJ C76 CHLOROPLASTIC n=1 Tax=Salix purpurea TaxID=77065 RepID=A0A9Q1A1B8_SALPP|nr:CHAPERONE PROTEIN DNAJ C76 CHLOROPLASTIC [Salix purpurea]